jgi:putative hydrolase of the HAD superfamily
VRQVLIFDADDTLWENNIYFERVIEQFLDWLAHPHLERAAIRAIIEDIEAVNAAAHGYGSEVFVRSLADCLTRLRERPATREEVAWIVETARLVVEHLVEPLPGVPETLAQLGSRYDMLLLTKGDQDEQRGKVSASGLADHFAGVRVVAEKDAAAYRRICEEFTLTPATTWMIGNSPRSDILPARQAGLNAVYIPNDNTWALERGTLDPADTGVLHLVSFSELLTHF